MTVAMQETLGYMIDTTRFGRIEVDDSRLITVMGGLLGFEQIHHFYLLNHAPDSPFLWLQAMDEPSLAFVAINPFDFFSDYDFTIGDADIERLGIERAEQVVVLSVVTINNLLVTANLVGPIIINTETHLAKQIVLNDTRYGTRHSLMTR